MAAEPAAPKRPSLTRTASFWFGDGASRSGTATRTADALSIGFGLAVAAAATLFVLSSWGGDATAAAVLFDVAIPALAIVAALLTAVLAVRALVRRAEECCHCGSRRFGRKGLVVSTSSVLFAFSCAYRAVNIADEGAAMCRGAPTRFNAPAAGRIVATVGEVALVVQISVYIEVTAMRLGAERGRLWSGVFARLTTVPFSTLVPVLCAELMSWTGVLSGNSKFYCAEYVLWMIIAFTWAWDGAELLHKSQRWKDQVAHAALLVAGLALFFFNAVLEIPHFFTYQREEVGNAVGEVPPVRVWECVQDANSPLWLKRLPFFFVYFVGASWSSVAVTHRFLRASHLATGVRRSSSPTAGGGLASRVEKTKVG